MKFILGKKMNMTQLWSDDKVIPCTAVQVGPCFVTQVKDDKTDSYKAIQVSYGERKAKNISKSVKGHLNKAISRDNVAFLREFRVDDTNNVELGKFIDASSFTVGDIVDVVGTSKGKGFQGVVKRHGFSGSKKTHGNKDQLRASGSIGATGPAHVFKGTKMGGRMGGDRVTTKNLEIVDIDLENNILFIKGAIPGSINSLIMVKGNGELILKDLNKEVKEEKVDVKEEAPVEEEKKEEEAPVEEEKKEEEAPVEEK
jgi:large subunit ribosomal protein L3